MDDLAHLLLGYILFRLMRLAGMKAGKLELAAILAGSILPDLLWAAGALSYNDAHTATWYIVAMVPFLIFARTRIAASGFAMSSFLHILVDSVMHARTTVLFAPLSDFSITGTFNYWEVWLATPAYWLAILALLALSFYLQKKKERRITF